MTATNMDTHVASTQNTSCDYSFYFLHTFRDKNQCLFGGHDFGGDESGSNLEAQHMDAQTIVHTLFDRIDMNHTEKAAILERA